MADGNKIPKSRVGRTVRIGTLAAGQALRQAGTAAGNVVRSAEKADAASERRNLEAAEQIVAALGTMKGAAMKIGQMMSFLDTGLIPPEHREEFQRKLAALQDAAPTVTFSQMRKVIESDLDGGIDEHFASFDQTPIAAASIGQVYRATLHDGREVAVKVQYPGVAAAVRADLKNLGMILRLAKRIAPGLEPKTIGAEIQARIEEELDYELEAQNQRTLARIYRGHPFIFVPEVVTALSRERVLVTEFVHGRNFAAVQTLSQAEKNRIGEIVFRFYFGCLYRHHQFSGDPHPGNFLLMDDGRVAFLDFGLFKRMPDEAVDLEIQVARAIIDGDADTIMRLGAQVGFFSEPEKFNPDRVLAHFRAASAWYTADREIELTQELAGQVVIDMSDPRSEYFSYLRHESAPPDHLFGRRMEVLALAVMAQLHTRANFHRIAREWFYGDPPVTELGRQEAGFYGPR